MGKLNQGMFGPITGRVGDMVYYVLNGENVARKIGKSTKPPSEKQLVARQRMGVVTRFLKTFSELISVGFFTDDKRPTSSPYNRAVSYNLTNATTGVYPDIEMNYSKALVNKGVLPGSDSCAVSLVAEGLRFNWSSPDLPYPRGNDQAMLLAYFPSLGSAVYSVEAGYRSVGSALLPVPADLLGERMEVYLAFVASDRKSVSDSVYLGMLN